MKVHELIALLEQYEPDADVLIMSQPSWPFEYDIDGVVERREIMSEDDDDEIDVSGRDGMPSDVFILEGSQLRYGNKNAWN